jgi:hypothetical protein
MHCRDNAAGLAMLASAPVSQIAAVAGLRRKTIESTGAVGPRTEPTLEPGLGVLLPDGNRSRSGADRPVTACAAEIDRLSLENWICERVRVAEARRRPQRCRHLDWCTTGASQV